MDAERSQRLRSVLTELVKIAFPKLHALANPEPDPEPPPEEPPQPPPQPVDDSQRRRAIAAVTAKRRVIHG
jgi:hypothetical protein